MGKLLNAFSGQNTNCAGGMIMNGSAWTSNLLHIDENEIFVPLENSESRKIWSKTLSILNSSDKKRKVILNIGMQSHRSVRMFYDFLSANKITNVTSDLFVEYFMRENHLKIEIIKRLIELGHDCLVVSDPPTRKIDNEISKSIEFWKFYDEQSLKIFHELGCNTFNASLFFKDEKFEDKFISDVIFEDGTRDWFHGSDEYYLELSRVIKSNYFL
jgi:hypothetical protein